MCETAPSRLAASSLSPTKLPRVPPPAAPPAPLVPNARRAPPLLFPTGPPVQFFPLRLEPARAPALLPLLHRASLQRAASQPHLQVPRASSGFLLSGARRLRAPVCPRQFSPPSLPLSP